LQTLAAPDDGVTVTERWNSWISSGARTSAHEALVALPINAKPLVDQHGCKDRLVDTLKQPWPQILVERKATIHDPAGKLFRIVQSPDPFAFFASSREPGFGG